MRSQRSGRITRYRAHHRQIQNASLELHKEIVFDHATVGAKRIEFDVRIFFHRLENITRLEGSRFEDGTSQVCLVRIASKSSDHSTRIVLPIRSVQPREGRNEIDAAVVGHRASQRLSVGTLGDQPKVVAQPLYKRTRDPELVGEMAGRATDM
jgi:hypothetical protein